jgi:hypothetical protein
MKQRSAIAVGAVTAICLGVGFAYVAHAHAQPQPLIQSAAPQGAPVTKHAIGTFDVKLIPQPPDDKAEGSTLARMSGEKQFHGDLEATARVQMLTAVTDVKGSAGYVAIERIAGTLNGRTGSFVLQHSGIMARGVPQQSVTVVPDSGTGQLAGISGKMTGTIDAAGKHSYDLEYTLPTAP